MLKQVGTVWMPKRTKCAICGSTGVEMAFRHNGKKIRAYHWHCFTEVECHLNIADIANVTVAIAQHRAQ